MKKLRKTNGITLIALIIIIVVLIILAGVIIIALNGNGGILNNANKAAEKYNSKASEEEELLGTLKNKLKEYTGENSDKPTKEPTNVEYFSWTTTDTEATITGFSDVGKEKYDAGEITELIIPSRYEEKNVVCIGQLAFSGCDKIIQIYIPSSIKKVVEWASMSGPFNHCSNVSNITFEEGMETIPAYIFANAKLKNGVKIVIPESVTKIAMDAFSSCSGLTELLVPKSVTMGGNGYYGAFEGCSNLAKVTFEEGIETIPDCIMRRTGVTEVVIPQSVKEIRSYAFYSCTELTKIDLGTGVTTIDSTAFEGCTGITELFIPKNVKVGGNGTYGAFEGCSNLTKVTFEEGMETIPSCIMRLTGVTEVTIPNSVKKIESSAFNQCTKLTKINLGTGVTTIGLRAFGGCSGLTELFVPKSVTMGGNGYYGAFEGCSNLAKVTFEEGIETIPDCIMRSTGVKEVTIPNSVKRIRPYAFYNAEGLITVKFLGTEEQWNAISVDNGNTPLTSATKQFNQ